MQHTRAWGCEKNLKAQSQKKRRKTKMLRAKSWLLSLPNILGGRSNWRVVRVGKKTTMKAKMWEGIGFQNINLKIPHHDNIHHWWTIIEIAYTFPFAMNKWRLSHRHLMQRSWGWNCIAWMMYCTFWRSWSIPYQSSFLQKNIILFLARRCGFQ